MLEFWQMSESFFFFFLKASLKENIFLQNDWLSDSQTYEGSSPETLITVGVMNRTLCNDNQPNWRISLDSLPDYSISMFEFDLNGFRRIVFHRNILVLHHSRCLSESIYHCPGFLCPIDSIAAGNVSEWAVASGSEKDGNSWCGRGQLFNSNAKNMKTLTRILSSPRLLSLPGWRGLCSGRSDSIYQIEVTNKLLDANTLYQLDKYSR